MNRKYNYYTTEFVKNVKQRQDKLIDDNDDPGDFWRVVSALVMFALLFIIAFVFFGGFGVDYQSFIN